MEVCIAYMHGKAVMLELREGVVFLDNEPQPIKNVTEEELTAFSEAVRAIPYSTDPGYAALVNAKRAAFIAGKHAKGPGSFHDEYLDALYAIEPQDFLGESL